MNWNKIKCFFGSHDWEITKGGRDHLHKTLSESRNCEVAISCAHKCTRCGKEEYKGMGVYHL